MICPWFPRFESCPGRRVDAVDPDARRKFFNLARLNQAPIAVEAVERIDALSAIEREINGATPQERARTRNERSQPLVGALEAWLRERRAKLSGKSETAKAIDYSLKRWPAFTRFSTRPSVHVQQRSRARRACNKAIYGTGWDGTVVLV